VPGGFNTLQRLSVADNPSLGCDPPPAASARGC